MPTLENDVLAFRFPDLDPKAGFRISFKRTLRIPDTEKTYGLPPGFGNFPLRHAEDYPGKLSSRTLERGGVILPMWQSEAMWMSFDCDGGYYSSRPAFPVAIKVAAGKINAVTGEAWRKGLHGAPQDYMVAPEQPWLDGFAIEEGVIRQFVAMPLGEGYTTEEQITGEAQWGGLQISVTPLKAEVWKRLCREHKARNRRPSMEIGMVCEEEVLMCRSATEMGLAPGGRMKQTIHDDPFDIEDWDLAATQRLFVTLVHGKDWSAVTGEPATHHPPTAKQYSDAGLPWFDYYGADTMAAPAPGGGKLGLVKSVASLFKANTGGTLPDSEDVTVQQVVKIGPAAARRPVMSWDGDE